MNTTCKACGNIHDSGSPCKCWAALRVSAKKQMDDVVKKGGCHCCGSTSRKLLQRKGTRVCKQCWEHQNNAPYGLQLIMAGYCPVCCGLPHRRDGETCSWCGEPYAELPAQDIDAWAGYGAFPVEEIDTVGDTWRDHVMVTCPVCKRARELHLPRADVSAASQRPCRSCSRVEENMRRNGKKNGTSI